MNKMEQNRNRLIVIVVARGGEGRDLGKIGKSD